MYSSRNKNTFLSFCFGTVRIFILASDGYHITSITSQCSTQYTAMKKVVAWIIFLDTWEIILQVCIGIWEAMCKKHVIVINLVGMLECKSVIVPLISRISILLEIVLVVVDILTNSMPSNSLGCFYFVWITQNFHTIIVQRVRFSQINDVKTNFHSFSCITYSEKIPLGMTVRIYIVW